MREGMEEYDAFKALTITPAKILKIADRTGSLKVGGVQGWSVIIATSTPAFAKMPGVRKVICSISTFADSQNC